VSRPRRLDCTIPDLSALQSLYRHPIVASSEDATLAADHIYAMIETGKLAPGQRLIEADLAGRIGVTRARVREALRVLSGIGAVELIPNRGARVLEIDSADLASMYDVIVGIVITGMETFGRKIGTPSDAIREALQIVTDRIDHAGTSGDALSLIRNQMEYFSLINYLSGNKFLNLALSRLNIALYHSEISKGLNFSLLKDSRDCSISMNEFIQKGLSAQAIIEFRSVVNIFSAVHLKAR
jgi:DNA-binding GntR family transcriptional regulator